jgi:hypothetical protein
LLLSPEVVDLRAQGEVLGAVKIEFFLARVLHGEIVTPNLDLIQLIGVDQHLPFGLAEQTLDILCLQLVAQILVLRGHRLLRPETLNSGSQSQR